MRERQKYMERKLKKRTERAEESVHKPAAQIDPGSI